MFFRHLLHQSRGRPIGNLLRRVVPLRILLGAEVRTGEDLLHADDLYALLPRLVEKFEMLLDVGVAYFFEWRVRWASMTCLDQTALYDTSHPESPYRFVLTGATTWRRINSQ